jgi:hypothetical protein
LTNLRKIYEFSMIGGGGGEGSGEGSGKGDGGSVRGCFVTESFFVHQQCKW